MNAQNKKWSQDDENTLIELVEKYENKGRTKQEAFEIVANIINRTKSACSSRYQLLKKNKYNQANNCSIEVKQATNHQNQKLLTLELIIQFLSKESNISQLTEENKHLQGKVKQLKYENEKLNNRLDLLKTEIQKKYDLLKTFG